jgi:archaemetzincin
MKRKVIPQITLLVFFVILPILLSFNKIDTSKEKKIIHITSLGSVNKKHLFLIKNWVESFYGIKCIIEKQEPLTKDLLSLSQTRYDADKILSTYNSNKHIFLLTDVDITHFNKIKNIKEYGIIGLGYEPGKTCIVSTFRIKKTSDKKFVERLNKVVLHEIGHNLGLHHCKYDKKCLMNDAKGTVRQIDQEKIWLCDNCKKIIGIH